MTLINALMTRANISQPHVEGVRYLGIHPNGHDPIETDKLVEGVRVVRKSDTSYHIMASGFVNGSNGAERLVERCVSPEHARARILARWW